jgi:hypothetical protein
MPSDLSASQIDEIHRLRARRFRTCDICRVTGLSLSQVKSVPHRNRATYHGNTEVSESNVIDGEPIAERVERLKRELREAHMEKMQSQNTNTRHGCTSALTTSPRVHGRTHKK